MPRGRRARAPGLCRADGGNAAAAARSARDRPWPDLERCRDCGPSGGRARQLPQLVLGTTDAIAMSVDALQSETPTRHSAGYNAVQLAQFGERDPVSLADMLVPSVEAFLDAATSRQGGERLLTGTGLSMTVSTMKAALLGEQIVHGLDIARAGKMAWPISRTDVLLVLGGVIVMLPDYLDRQRTYGLHGAYEMRFRGGPRYRLQVDDGIATVTRPGRSVYCWVAAEPATFLLTGP
jgi:hypothetical protein